MSRRFGIMGRIWSKMDIDARKKVLVMTFVSPQTINKHYNKSWSELPQMAKTIFETYIEKQILETF